METAFLPDVFRCSTVHLIMLARAGTIYPTAGRFLCLVCAENSTLQFEGRLAGEEQGTY